MSNYIRSLPCSGGIFCQPRAKSLTPLLRNEEGSHNNSIAELSMLSKSSSKVGIQIPKCRNGAIDLIIDKLNCISTKDIRKYIYATDKDLKLKIDSLKVMSRFDINKFTRDRLWGNKKRVIKASEDEIKRDIIKCSKFVKNDIL